VVRILLLKKYQPVRKRVFFILEKLYGVFKRIRQQVLR